LGGVPRSAQRCRHLNGGSSLRDSDFSPYAVTLGRYAVFGLISMVMVPFTLKHIRALSSADWRKVAWLAMIGHLLYYLFLATGIQLSDLPGPTVVIGLLPLTVPVFANLRKQELPWRTLAIPLLGIATGLLLVNGHEYQRIEAREGLLRYGLGMSSAFAALACWPWYGIINAAWLGGLLR